MATPPKGRKRRPSPRHGAVAQCWWSSVTVCGFTFQFASRDQLLEVIEFYSRKTHPSSRLPGVGVNYAAYGDHEEAQRWFERVPLYLQREGKRQKVLATLKAALGPDEPVRSDRAPARRPRQPVRPKTTRG